MPTVEQLRSEFDVLADAHAQALVLIEQLATRVEELEHRLGPDLSKTVAADIAVHMKTMVIDGRPRQFFDSNGFLAAIGERV